MAIELDGAEVTQFDQWYEKRDVDSKGCLHFRNLNPQSAELLRRAEEYKTEMDMRCHDYDKLEMLVDAEVISKKPDLPNVSSGETAGLIRRMARNLVQHTPNVEITSVFDDDSLNGVLSRHILLSKIVGSETYSNDMQQNLFASVKTSLTIGFDCVIPLLLNAPDGSWYIKYDTIHYRDVWPEPGVKDIRDATEVFVRRYLSRGEVKQLIATNAPGWDCAALRQLLNTSPKPPNKAEQSRSFQDKKRRVSSSGYEIVTWYSSGGSDFLTFSPTQHTLLRVEKNVHPAKSHPVFFLILEKDSQTPLGKSQVELLLGRQEFQDLMHNGSMKLWYRNINPSIIGYGTVNSIPNLSPGKYTQISNPNARIEPFEVNTQTLAQVPQLAQANLGSMVSMVGAADQQMAVQAGNGFSATPQGVEAQQQMVDITTNNYQKAIESFFSHYCSYALTIYFHELQSIKKMVPTADTRKSLLNAGMVVNKEDGTVTNVVEDALEEDGTLNVDFSDMAIEYFVRCVPGSLVELEDEKQARILKELFVPLSQAMPALAATQDQEVLRRAAATMEFILRKELELSGSVHSNELVELFKAGPTEQFSEYEERISSIEGAVGGSEAMAEGLTSAATAITQMQEQIRTIAEMQGVLLQKLGIENLTFEAPTNNGAGNTMTNGQQPVNM